MPTPIPSTLAGETLAGMTPRETDLSSRQLRSWPERIKDEAVFSARTTLRSYVDMIRKRLVEVATRSVIPDEAERMLRRTLEEVGYRPETGFPDNRGRVPPATPGSITDLSSSRRIQLILDTNVKQARSLGQIASSENPVFLMTNPAWKLTRTGARRKPRGDWKRRWAEAGAACGWKGALKNAMVALKTSPIWHEIGQGAGGFRDTIGTDYPPFAFGSGLAWVNVGRREWKRLCAAEGIPDGLEEISAIAKATKAAQEAEGGKGAYGASAKPGVAQGFARGIMEGLIRGAGGSAFIPDTRARDAARKALEASMAASGASLDANKAARDRIAGIVSAAAGEDWAETVAEAGRKATAELDAARQTVMAARARLAAFLRSVQTAPVPRDAAAQREQAARMAKLSEAADKTRRVFGEAGKAATEKADAVARLASAEGA